MVENSAGISRIQGMLPNIGKYNSKPREHVKSLERPIELTCASSCVS